MTLLILAFALIWLTLLSASKGWSRIENYSRIFFVAALIAWLRISADLPDLGGGEKRLLIWFAWGLGFALLGETLLAFTQLGTWAYLAFPLSAVFFALGFDVFRPNAYAYLPATILAILVGLVAARAALRLLQALDARGRSSYRFAALLYTASIALMLFAAFYKLMDRNWLLPWSYLAAGGALLFALSQLWIGWEKITDAAVVEARNARAAFQLGFLLLTLAAFFHYQQYF